MALTRSLEFKDRWVFSLIQAVSEACGATEPIVFTDNETPVKFVVEMSLNEFTRLYSALLTGADLTYPEQAHDVVWILLRQLECPVSICEEIIECLQPFFDALETQLTGIEEQISGVQQAIEDNAAQQPEPIENGTADERCGGATYVVKAMNEKNLQVYNSAETSFVDDLFEMIPVVIEAIPGIGALPFDELFEVVNWYFENQKVDYEADYALIEADMICDLKCFVEANDNVFDIGVWNDWLVHVGATYPTNRAAQLFARYAPVHQTFINQILALINANQSLQAYFEELAQQYYAGTQDPVVCAGCSCPAPLDPVIALTPNTCIPATITGSGSIIHDTGEFYIVSTTPVSGGHAFVIKDAANQLFRYEFDSTVSGGDVEFVRLDNRNGGVQDCKVYDHVGWQDQNQYLMQLSGAWSAPATVRLRIF